jgi:hypothetical protein
MAASGRTFHAKAALLLSTAFGAALVAGLFASAPVRAQEQAPTAFGQAMPQQYFFNRMTNPHPAAPSGGASGAQPGGAQGAGAQAAAEDDDDGPGPYPKRYLFNRLFGSGGGQTAPAAPAPAPAAAAPPAAAAK